MISSRRIKWWYFWPIINRVLTSYIFYFWVRLFYSTLSWKNFEWWNFSSISYQVIIRPSVQSADVDHWVLDDDWSMFLARNEEIGSLWPMQYRILHFTNKSSLLSPIKLSSWRQILACTLIWININSNFKSSVMKSWSDVFSK